MTSLPRWHIHCNDMSPSCGGSPRMVVFHKQKMLLKWLFWKHFFIVEKDYSKSNFFLYLEQPFWKYILYISKMAFLKALFWLMEGPFRKQKLQSGIKSIFCIFQKGRSRSTIFAYEKSVSEGSFRKSIYILMECLFWKKIWNSK